MPDKKSKETTARTRLLNAQKDIEAIKKQKTNPYFSSNYADINDLLDAVKPILNDNDLILVQPLVVRRGKAAVSTRIIDAVSGKRILSSLILLPEQDNPQKMGSAITYYRRYALQSLLALEVEDDDGAKASGTVKRRTPAKAAPAANKDAACPECPIGKLHKRQSGGQWVVACDQCSHKKNYPLSKEPTV